MRSPHWDTPEGYRVNSYCTSCGRDFSNDDLFTRHRTGVNEYTYSEGLNFDPPIGDGRRCKTDEEMNADGMYFMTNEEMFAGRHKHRIGFGVQMWFDPLKAEQAKTAFRPSLP